MLFGNEKLSKKDKQFCIGCGGLVAQRCINGSEDSAAKLDKAAVGLSADIYQRFKAELIYCRIFIAFYIFKYELQIKSVDFLKFLKFEEWDTGFHLRLKKSWSNYSSYLVSYKIVEYSKIFLENGSVFSGLCINDSIVDYLLENSGFKDSERSHFDTTALREFFINDCIEHQSYVDNIIFFVSLDSEIRDGLAKGS